MSDDLLVDAATSTTLVDSLADAPSITATAPLLEGEIGAPDFDAMAEPLRPRYEELQQVELNQMRKRVEVLADTRKFLRAAREWPDAFRRRSVRLGISSKPPARIETLAVKWFFKKTTKGDTSINRVADLLGAMTYEYDADLPAADLVEQVMRDGPTEVAKKYHATQPSTATRSSSPPLIEAAEIAFESHEPVPTTKLFERSGGNVTEIRLLVGIWKPGALPEVYAVQPDEAMIRQALRQLE